MAENPLAVDGERLLSFAQTLDWSSMKRLPETPAPPVEHGPLARACRAFLDNLIRLKILDRTEIDRFLTAHSDHLPYLSDGEEIGRSLLDAGLLTPYQLDRILAGNTHGLVLGYYRVLDRLGEGGMGVVFRGEHMLMKRKAAIKVLPVDEGCPTVLLERFYNEMRVLAGLQHPHIVMAYDSGQVDPPPGLPLLLYLVMELVDGCDLEHYVCEHGVLPVGKACEWIRQAASGLQEAHNHFLVHRDIKPSNILITRDEQIKLVDFGLVRQFSLGLTDPKATLGTITFMSPEQGIDPTSVGTHADIYSLGATLFWLLTGHAPYPRVATITEALRQLQSSPPRKLRLFRPDAPVELEAVIDRLLDRDPMRRPPMALSVMKYLEPFVAC